MNGAYQFSKCPRWLTSPMLYPTITFIPYRSATTFIQMIELWKHSIQTIVTYDFLRCILHFFALLTPCLPPRNCRICFPKLDIHGWSSYPTFFRWLSGISQASERAVPIRVGLQKHSHTKRFRFTTPAHPRWCLNFEERDKGRFSSSFTTHTSVSSKRTVHHTKYNIRFTDWWVIDDRTVTWTS